MCAHLQVVVNVPLSDKTRGMFNDETIGKMKKGAILVCQSLLFIRTDTRCNSTQTQLQRNAPCLT